MAIDMVTIPSAEYERLVSKAVQYEDLIDDPIRIPVARTIEKFSELMRRIEVLESVSGIAAPEHNGMYADAALGVLVRRIPPKWLLERNSVGGWTAWENNSCFGNLSHPQSRAFNTPEEALKAGLEAGGG